MKTYWKDIVSSVLVVLGAVVVFAKLQAYSWWLLGSWGGALAVISVIGLAILATNAVEIAKLLDMTSFLEACLWMATITVAVVGLFSNTTRLEFIWTAALIGVSWLAQFSRHLWVTTHHHTIHYAPTR